MTDHSAGIPFVRVLQKEDSESKMQRKFTKDWRKKDLKEKRRLKDDKEKKQFMELSNVFVQLGVNYEGGLEAIRNRWEGKRVLEVFSLPEEAQRFLKKNFNYFIQRDDWGVDRLHFPVVELSEKEADAPKAPPYRTLQALAKLSKQPLSSVEAVYSALVNLSRQQLAKHRRFRLPGIARLSVRYKPALPARKGINPWTKKEANLPASSEQNKVRSRPDKELVEWATKSIPVVPPTSKKKHQKSKEKPKHKSKKKYTRYFDKQESFHIA